MWDILDIKLGSWLCHCHLFRTVTALIYYCPSTGCGGCFWRILLGMSLPTLKQFTLLTFRISGCLASLTSLSIHLLPTSFVLKFSQENLLGEAEMYYTPNTNLIKRDGLHTISGDVSFRNYLTFANTNIDIITLTSSL